MDIGAIVFKWGDLHPALHSWQWMGDSYLLTGQPYGPYATHSPAGP